MDRDYLPAHEKGTSSPVVVPSTDKILTPFSLTFFRRQNNSVSQDDKEKIS